jgi:hypothetical protein
MDLVHKFVLKKNASFTSKFLQPGVGIMLVVFGMTLLYLSMTINLMVDTVINNTAVAIIQGASINDFLPAIKGLLANGTILNVPFGILVATSSASVLLIYIGVICLKFHYLKKSMKEMLTKRFWMTWHMFRED